MNLATEEQIARMLAFQLGFPYVNLAENPPDHAAVVVIPKEIALERVCVAVSLEKNLLTVAMSDPLMFSLVEDLESQTGHPIRQVVTTKSDILDAIRARYPDKPLTVRDAAAGGSEPAVTGAVLNASSEGARIIDLADLVVKSAITSKASDIHVEPMEDHVLIRHRLDGVLKEVMDLPKRVHEGLIDRLKILAGMDIGEKRLPQDGRLRSTAEDGTEIHFRVSTLRTLFGEKVVMRVLDHRRGVPALEEIGMSATVLEEMRA